MLPQIRFGTRVRDITNLIDDAISIQTIHKVREAKIKKD